MKTETLDYAALLHAVAAHLQAHPHLPLVDVNRSSRMGLQIAAYVYRGEPSGADAVLLWAYTVDEPVIELREHDGPATQIRLTGEIGQHRVQVWDVDRGGLDRLRTGPGITQISLAELAAYVAGEHPDIAPAGRDGGAR